MANEHDDAGDGDSGDFILDLEADFAPSAQDDTEKGKSVEPKKSTRAERRIQRLIAERNEAAGEITQLKKKLEALEATVDKSAKASKQKATISAQVSTAQESLRAAKEALKAATSSGEPDEIAEATVAVTTAAHDLAQAQAWAAYEEMEKEPEKPTAPEENREEQVKRFISQLSPRERRWYNKNKDWYLQDREMTAAAARFHQQLLNKGYDPSDDDDPEFGADAYFGEMDKRIRKRFPDWFDEDEEEETVTTPAKRKAPPVSTPAGGGTKTSDGKIRVKLTPAEVDMAKRLGLTPQKYAAEKLKLQNRRKTQ